jgi:hypothetical protein
LVQFLNAFPETMIAVAMLAMLAILASFEQTRCWALLAVGVSEPPADPSAPRPQ